MLVSHLRNMRSVAIAYASVKVAPAGTIVCRIDGVTRRRLGGLDSHDQRNTLAMMLEAECPFVRLAYGPPDADTSHSLTLSQAATALSKVRSHPATCRACNAPTGHVSRCPLA